MAVAERLFLAVDLRLGIDLVDSHFQPLSALADCPAGGGGLGGAVSRSLPG